SHCSWAEDKGLRLRGDIRILRSKHNSWAKLERSFESIVLMAQQNAITATRISGDLRLHAANPGPEWAHAEPVRFSTDWQGKNADPELETEVRVLWSPET